MCSLMNIRQDNRRGIHTYPVDAFVAASITNTDASGSAEDAQAMAVNAAGALGRLVDILAAKGLLDAKEVGDIASETEGELSLIA